MAHAMKANRQVWTWLAYALVSVLGVAIMVVGARERQAHLLFGGAMFLLMAATGLLHMRALRPGRGPRAPGAYRAR